MGGGNMKWSIPEKMVEQGRKYADEGRVTNISQDLENQTWHAEVIGKAIYKVTLDGTPKEEDRCTCEDWNKKKYCKHTVAVELALRLKGLNRVLNQNKNLKTTYKAPSLGSVLTAGLAKIQNIETEILLSDEQKLEVSYTVESVPTSPHHGQRDVWCLSLKVGIKDERQYAIKNIAKFLEDWSQGNSYQLTDEQMIYLNHNNFDEQDKQLLGFIWNIYLSQKVTTAVANYGRNQLKPRHLLLPKSELLELLGDLEQLEKLNLLLNKEKFQSTPFTEALPFDFEVIAAKNGYQLKVHTEVIHYWEYYRFLYVPKGIYQFDYQQMTIYETLRQLLKRTREPVILFSEEEVSDLFTFVLPQLEKIGEIHVSEALDSDVIRQPLETKLSFELTGNQLQCDIAFCYGGVIFSRNQEIASESTEQQKVVRNPLQEERVNRLLEKYSYEASGKYFVKPFPQAEDRYAFYTKELSVLRKVGEVSLSEELQERYLAGLQQTPKITVKENGSWFDINFDISGIAEEDVNGLMLSLLEKKSFHQLENGQMISLESEEYQETIQGLQNVRQYLTIKDNQFMIPKYRSLQLNDALAKTEEVIFSEEFTQMTKDLTQLENLSDELPIGITADLREYQLIGYRWLKMLRKYGLGGILADDMGLGKTLQGITYLLSEKEQGETKPALVVAPASLVYNWQNECQKFAPSLKTVVVIGTKEERENILNDASNYDVLIVSYASLRQDGERYQEIPISTLLLDEAQMVKNASTKTFQAIKKLKTAHRFALSGTPIENKLEELWALFTIVMPGFFPNKTQFNKFTATEVAKMIKPFVLRREKKEVLKDLPDKIESNLLSPLTEEQKTTYLAHLRQMQTSVKGMDSKAFKENHLSILAGLTRLRQICCDPRLFIEGYNGGSGKLEQVKELIIAAKANGRRILLFSQFTGMLSILENELNDLSIETFYLHGGTKPKERIEMVDSFNDNEKDVFLISLKAGGTGLNLTGADTVILYDLWWNPAVEEQAASRAHRMGQKKTVEVWRLIAEGTIEEKMFRLQEGKRQLFDAVMSDSDGSKLQKLSEEDIRDILLITE